MNFSSSKFKKILIFQEIEIANPKIKKVLILSKKSFPYISGNKTFKKSFLYFRRELSELKKKKKKNHSKKVYYILENGTF